MAGVVVTRSVYLRIDFALIGQRIKRNVKSRPSPARDVSYFR